MPGLPLSAAFDALGAFIAFAVLGAFAALGAFAVLGAFAALVAPEPFIQAATEIGETLNLLEAALWPPRPFTTLWLVAKSTISFFCASV